MKYFTLSRLYRLGPMAVMTMIALLLSVSNAYAMTVEEAKTAGLIGEQRDGYLGLVQEVVPPEVLALVNDVNSQRRERYQQIARENGISINEVTQLAYARAVEATRRGHYVQNAEGQWVRKP